MEAVREKCVNLGGRCEVLGAISGSPNVAIYNDVLECGNQGVIMPGLGPRHRCTPREEVLAVLASDITDALVFPGCYPLKAVTDPLSEAGVRLHVDIAYDTSLDDLINGPPLETVFVSTSSDLFLTRWSATPLKSLRDLSPIAQTIVLKESRGGSRALSRGAEACAPAFVGKAQHSIGVGDCFDAAYVSLAGREEHDRLELSSAVAAAYAETWDLAKFIAAARRVLDGGEPLDGYASIRLPWEWRPGRSIYIAAPDFPGVNIAPLERLVAALEYHNFHCRLPVRENGLADTSLPAHELESICEADLRLLEDCRLLVGVLLYDDPGTLIEIGIAAGRGRPVIVYDPYHLARNVILRCVPRVVSSDLSEVVTAVFETIGEMNEA
ncbi:MAG: nucleoside 2-deoxyribosyltransferase [Thermoleophilia bacterium]|nr:nucleoside 2-deoxyribosyltransferase [Thermoleophilia bacterium]